MQLRNAFIFSLKQVIECYTTFIINEASLLGVYNKIIFNLRAIVMGV